MHILHCYLHEALWKVANFQDMNVLRRILQQLKILIGSNFAMAVLKNLKKDSEKRLRLKSVESRSKSF